MLGYASSLVGATLKTVALQVATTALNAAITMGASLIVGGIITAISNWVRQDEILAEKAETAKQKIDELNNNYKEHSQLVSDSAKRYAELAQGVDQFSGKNLSLNDDDYKEFLDLSNQLAEAFPTLSRHYDENGNAILQLSGNVDTIVGSLNNLIEAERSVKNQEIADELPTVYKNANNKSDDYKKQIDELKEQRQTLIDSLGDVQSDDFSKNFIDGLEKSMISVEGENLETLSKMKDDYLKILKDANIDYEELTPDYENKDGVDVPVRFNIKINSSEEDIEKAKKTIKANVENLASEYEGDISELNDKIQSVQDKNKANWSSLTGSIAAWLDTEDSYKTMSDDMQSTIQNIVNNLDWSKLNFSSWEKAKQYIQDNILSLFQTSDGKDVLKKIEVMFGIQTQFNNGEITVNEYQKKLKTFLDEISTLAPDTQKAIKLIFGISTDKDGTTTSSIDTMVNNVKSKLKDKFDDKVGELSLDDLQVASKFEIPEGTLLSWDELKQKIEETKNAASEETTTSFSTLFDGSDFGDRISYLSQQFQNGKISAHDYFQSIRDELANTDFSEFTDQAAAAQQFFTDSTQQVASGMSDLINSYNKGEISATEYLDGYTSMAETLSALTDDLQNNSVAWNENGEAISDGTNQALDNAQSDLASAIEGINQYQDSIYSLEQITSGAITAGSDEFTAHAQVIAEDLAYIVQNGGYMADQIASTMGTTTSEIANSLTNSVDNQALASQAIAGNTNASIEQMASAVSTLFAELGNQIGNFKATINFAPKVNGVEHFSAIKIGGKEIVGGDIPNLTYDIKGSSSSLKSIGSAISSFGKVLSSNIAAQKVDYKKFSTIPTNSSGKERSYTPNKSVTNNYNNKLKNNKSSGKSGSGGSGGKNSGGDAEKQNEEYLDKFMAYQKARLEAGKITYQQYSQYVSDELERMYKNGEISASKYYSAVKDMIDEQKSIYDAALKGVTKLLDDEIDKWKDKIDVIEKNNDKLNEQKDKYDSILSAIQKVYDDEIKKANKKKDSIQDVIDAMSDENDEYERQKKLQEAIYNLNKANSQKTKYLLKDGQFVYSTDNSAIRDAQDSLHDAQYDVDVANLKKQQDDIDNYIDTLNEFKDKWNEISDAFSEAQDTMNLKQYLGSEYQRIILSNNLADIENFKNQYVAVESQINSNEQLKTSYEEKVNYYNNLKQQWEDCTSKYDDEMNKLYASQILGANWESEVLSGRLQTLNNFTSEYEKLCQRQADAAVNAANTEVQASKNAAAGVASASSSVVGSGGGSSSGGSSSSTHKVTYDKNNNPNKPALKSNDYWTYEKLSKKGYSTSGQASSHISDYASKGANGFTQIGNKYFIVKWIANAGTPANASKAKNKLEKDNPKKKGKYGYAKRYHKGLELGKIEALPKDKAFDLVQDVGINGLKADEVPIIAKKREAVITEEQIENLAKTLHLVPVQNEIMEKMSKISLGDLPMNTPKMNFDANKVGQNVTKNNFAPSVTLNLNCPNVSSVSDAKAITDVVDKQLNKFANDFYQASLHYVNKK